MFLKIDMIYFRTSLTHTHTHTHTHLLYPVRKELFAQFADMKSLGTGFYFGKSEYHALLM